MKYLILLSTIFLIFLSYNPDSDNNYSDYDVYQYVKQCKSELGIKQNLPQLSCLDGEQVAIYVDDHEIKGNNWKQLANAKKCDNPHWLGGDMGCWTYSHLQVLQLDKDNVMVLNCRQKGGQNNKNWYRKTKTNLGMNQQQRKQQYHSAYSFGSEKSELYYLYNTFNDIGIILRNTQTGKACYLTQYGMPSSGFLPPLDRPLPNKTDFLNAISTKQARPPKDFPDELWYRDANQAFKSPSITANSGCIDCHNAHGFKYSPYINSSHGIPDIYSMTDLPMLLVGEPFIQHFKHSNFLQVTTDPIDGMKQLCTSCHKMTTSGTCGKSINYATGQPGTILHNWLTTSLKDNWMPPVKTNLQLMNKHVSAIKCCCENPNAKGCKSRKFGPTVEDLAEDFEQDGGWINGQGSNDCQKIMETK